MLKIVYEYPTSFGDMGSYLSESDYNDMYNWPAVRDWYDTAVQSRDFDGLFEDYITNLKKQCVKVYAKVMTEKE